MVAVATPDVGFVACIEPGMLEAQTLLLFASLRRFGGAFAGAAGYALSPRGRVIGDAARRGLEALQVEYSDRVLNTDCPQYGSANRVAAAGFIEATTRHELICVLDSDTLFVREPAAFRLADGIDAALRPVDVKGMCTAGPRDDSDGYWRRLCALGGVAYEQLPFTVATVDRARVRASYNGGLVLARAARGLMQRWAELFFRSIREGLVPTPGAAALRSAVGQVPAATARLWGSNQAALSVALWGATRRIIELGPGYNFPLHLVQQMDDVQRAPLNEIVHLHYHWMFEREEIAATPLLATRGPLPPEVREWLRARLPLS